MRRLLINNNNTGLPRPLRGLAMTDSSVVTTKNPIITTNSSVVATKNSVIANAVKQSIIFIIAIFIISSCVKEPFTPTNESTEGMAWIDVNFGTEKGLELSTKAHQSEDSENQISDIFVFVFDNSGTKVFEHYFVDSDKVANVAAFRDNANQHKRCWYVNNAVNPSVGGFRIHTPTGNNFKIFVITNLDTDRTYVSSALLARNIHKISDLENFKLFLNVNSVERGTKFTSSGFISGVNIEAPNRKEGEDSWTVGIGHNKFISGNSTINLRRVDAKVKFTFRMGNRPDSLGQTVRSFTPLRWKIVNVPRRAYIIEKEVDASNPAGDLSKEKYGDYAGDFFDTEWRVFEDYLTNNSASFAFYMLENRLQPKKTVTDYWQRSLREKDEQHKNKSIDVDYLGDNFLTYSKNMLNFEYANDFSTYILVQGRVEMDLTNDDAGQVLGADVSYMVHLGGEWSRVKFGDRWYKDEYSNVSSFDTKRNHSYNYVVTINSVNNIRVEVDTSEGTYDEETFRENQPGAWGNVTIAKEEIAVCDAHYVSKTLTFHANNLVKEGTSYADKLTWAVNTPFSNAAYDYNNPEATPLSTIDYKWVHFRLNKKDNAGQYFEDQRRKYTPRVFASSENERLGNRENKEDDGTDGLTGYHNDGIMDVVQLVEYMRTQADLYAAHYWDPSKPASDFDTTAEENGGPKICVTVFVDEYYYESHPLSGTVSPTLWKRFINTDDRYMHILSDSNMSYDAESRATGSVTTIQQKSIQSIYNIDETNQSLSKAWGLEHIDEFPDIWEWKPLQNKGNSDNYNGYQNTLKLWNLCGSSSSTFIENIRWDTYMEIEVNNDTPQLSAENRSLRYSCMTRNRDNNGNGKIDEDEVRWYTASMGQLVNLYMGENFISPTSRLYNREADTRNTPGTPAVSEYEDGLVKREGWMQHVVSSTSYPGKLEQPTIVWAEEGIATGNYSYSDETVPTKMTVRCCRNLGMDSEPMTENPEQIVLVEEVVRGGHTYQVFDTNNLMPNSKRDYVSEELPLHFENNPASLLYDKFEVYYQDTNIGVTQSFKQYNDDLNNTMISRCPTGYRTPNQRELAVIKYFGAGLNNSFSRTAWSMGGYQTNPDLRKDPSKWGFVVSGGNITLYKAYTGSVVRCVRDIRVR